MIITMEMLMWDKKNEQRNFVGRILKNYFQTSTGNIFQHIPENDLPDVANPGHWIQQQAIMIRTISNYWILMVIRYLLAQGKHPTHCSFMKKWSRVKGQGNVNNAVACVVTVVIPKPSYYIVYNGCIILLQWDFCGKLEWNVNVGGEVAQISMLHYRHLNLSKNTTCNHILQTNNPFAKISILLYL